MVQGFCPVVTPTSGGFRLNYFRFFSRFLGRFRGVPGRLSESSGRFCVLHKPIFLGVILLGMNKSGPWKFSWTSSRKRNKNENTASEEAKVEATAMGSSRQKVESRAEKGADSTCFYLLACFFLSDPTCFSPTYQRKRFRRIRLS